MKPRLPPSRMARAIYVGWKSLTADHDSRRPPDKILRLQNRRVQKMTAYASRWVPYYRELFERLKIHPQDIRSADDLARLPIIEPEDLRKDPLRFVSTEKPIQNHIKLISGGSTGIPRTLYHTYEAFVRSVAQGERARRIQTEPMGKSRGYRNALVIPAESTTHEIQRFMTDLIWMPPRLSVQRRVFDFFQPIETVVSELNRFRPDMIYTYGSFLEMLISFLENHPNSFQKPKVIVYSSTVLQESVRRIIEDRHGIPLFSLYQSVEMLILGFECEKHSGLHINIDFYPTRIVNDHGMDLPEGCEGDIVVSNLVNRGTVLFNYRLGDRAFWQVNDCSCGRTLPLLSQVQGRCDDWLELASGTIINPQILCKIFRAEPEIWQYRFIQEAMDRIILLMVIRPKSDQKAIETRIRRNMMEILSERDTLHIRFVEKIPPLPGGKHRAVVSLCRKPSSEKTYFSAKKTNEHI